MTPNAPESGATPRVARVPLSPGTVAQRYLAVRGQSDTLAAPLSAEDATAQSMPSCSPAKWHLAHTTWFSETFVLERFDPGFRPIDERFRVLFNSYYNTVGEQAPRHERGLMTRPSLDAVRRYRARTDELVLRLLETRDDPEIVELIELGLQHEQQHQELLLMDIKHLFSRSPLRPVYREPDGFETGSPGAMGWAAFDAGVRVIGTPADAGFAYDCERPEHQDMVHAFAIADRLVTNAEYLAFIDAGGYADVNLWLDAGWRWRRDGDVEAPLYWRREGSRWAEFTLRGEQPLDLDRPVCHVSFFEADAYARWRGCRLPAEAEWETACVESGAANAHREGSAGNFLGSASLHPDAPHDARGPRQMLGDAWEWTRSDFGPYPGYRPPEGPLGEYNGKFMCGHFVLRGGCCVTPRDHIRPGYRNFFAPGDRWMFSGIRLAKDGS